jgi:hypothetical protein
MSANENMNVLTELPKPLHNGIMNFLSRHYRLSLVGDHEQDRTDRNSEQRDQDDGRQRCDGLSRVGIGGQPISKRRYEFTNIRQRCKGTKE